MPRPKILVADDSHTIRVVVEQTLAGRGYDVVTVTNGKEAIDFARHDCPDLLVLDILMPEMDGYAVCEQLQEMGEPWSRLPIVFFSRIKSHALELLGKQFGAYIVKPVTADALLETISQFVAPSEEPDVKQALSH